MVPPRPILIAGPTASGKSSLAMDLADRHGGLVINADSMQVYRELSILTARPSDAQMARVPHALYGHVSGCEAYSVGRWVEDVRGAIDDARDLGLRPIIVGGTGLYFKALLEGLAGVPSIPADIRRYWRNEAVVLGPRGLHAKLVERDLVMASRLAPGDTQRVTRALEVFTATGRSLADWQRAPGEPVLRPEDTERLVVVMDRSALLIRCDQRFDAMVAAGGVQEVERLQTLAIDPSLPIMRALGVAPLLAFLRGEMNRDEAVQRAKIDTRQYAKRQLTWLRRHMCAWNIHVLE